MTNVNASRQDVEKRLAEHYTEKLKGKVWCAFDESKRAYAIRGEGLPAHPDLKEQYPKGWSMLDYIKPTQAYKILGIKSEPKILKRILSVKIKRVLDTDPDTSWLGEYSNKRTSEYSIDRAHAEDCASVSLAAKQASDTLSHAQQTVGDIQNQLQAEDNREKWEALNEAYFQLEELAGEVTECDCGEHGDMERGQYRYFNPSLNYVDENGQIRPEETPQTVREYTRQDYERMERLNRGDWCFLGIVAQAEIFLGDRVQKIDASLWGVESDSDASTLGQIEQEELSELRDQLLGLGFGKRAVSIAFKSIEREEE